MSSIVDAVPRGGVADLKHRPSKLDLLDSTTLTSFPIPHPVRDTQSPLERLDGEISQLRLPKAYPFFTGEVSGGKGHVSGGAANEYQDPDSYWHVASTMQSSTIITPPSSSETETTVEFDYKAVLDESFGRVHSAPSIDKCNDAYIRSILSGAKSFGTLHYCSMCDSPLYELSGLIPDDLQQREMICETCLNNDEVENEDDGECTVQIVDELDMTLQSEEDFNTTIIVRSDGNIRFQSIITHLRSISMRDLRLRESMADLRLSSPSQSVWSMMRRMIFGQSP